MGRPTKYKPAFCSQSVTLSRLGATDADLADFFDVSEQTINTWKSKHPEFLESLKEGKEIADTAVVRSLFQRATGYSCPDTKFATFEGRITDSKEYTKHYPPETVACIFWLKNRQPHLWRDKQVVAVDHTVEDRRKARETSEDTEFAEKIAKAGKRVVSKIEAVDRFDN